MIDHESRATGIEQRERELLAQRRDRVFRRAVDPRRAHVHAYLPGQGARQHEQQQQQQQQHSQQH